MTSSILLYVQHLLGIGHLRRAANLALGLTGRGFRVTLVSGGPSPPGFGVPGVKLIQLPAVRAPDATFSGLIDAEGRPPSPTLWAERLETLKDAALAARPDAVITELFPFGRRRFAREIITLLDLCRTMRPRPLIVASLRDILEDHGKPGRVAESLAWFEAYYDRALVHGDPAILTVDESFPAIRAIASRLHYTGFVAPPASPREIRGGEVVVSAGSGAVSEDLIWLALAARPLTRLSSTPWRAIAGPFADPGALARLQRQADGVRIEAAREDLPLLLKRARLSISRAGYNTVIETLQAGTRAVLVPFEGAGETEQRARAGAFARQGLVETVPPGADAAALAAAIERALDHPPPGAIDCAGAGRSADLIQGWLKER